MDFKAWSFRVAHFQVMAFRQRQIREKLVFDNEALEQLTRDASEHDDTYELRKDGLDDCIMKLSERQREVLHRFYRDGEPMNAIAVTLNRTANAISQLLFRIRKTLVACVSENNREGATDVL